MMSKITFKKLCCYLAGEVNCGKSDCFLVGMAGLMAMLIIFGWLNII